MILISMVDFVLKQKEKMNCLLSQNAFEYYKTTSRYANFLKEPLKLEMFVPCDDDGNFLENPSNKIYPASMSFSNEIEYYNLKHQQAKEKVLFDGFRFQNEGYVTNGIFKFNEEYLENKTIEDLIQFDLTLTQTAIEKLGL